MTSELANIVRPFAALISPYHLTTREPASLVALQLAQSATTLLIAPQSNHVTEQSIRQQATASPAFGAYMRSWEWAMQIFNEGVITTTAAGEDPVEHIRHACNHLDQDPACAALTPFRRPELFENDTAYLRAASADILKAGPNPSISIPIAAGLDAFAAQHRLIVARSAPVSLVQQAEEKLGRVIFRTSIPAIIQGSAERLLLVRALLSQQREKLAIAISTAFETRDPAPLKVAANRYARAFEAERADICAPPGPGEENEVRIILGEASIVGMQLPVDAVFRSSVAAITGRPAQESHAPNSVRTILIRSVGGR